MISEERVEKSLVYLAESDEPYAHAHATAKAIEKEEKIVKAQEHLRSMFDDARKEQAKAE